MKGVTDGMVGFLGEDEAPTVQRPIKERQSRKGDPDTSKQAGDAAKEWTGDLARAVLLCIVELEQHADHGATANDIVMRLAYTGEAPQQNSVSRRLTSLQRHGYVADGGERKPSTRRHGHPLIVWSSTPKGRDWLTEGVS